MSRVDVGDSRMGGAILVEENEAGGRGREGERDNKGAQRKESVEYAEEENG